MTGSYKIWWLGDAACSSGLAPSLELHDAVQVASVVVTNLDLRLLFLIKVYRRYRPKRVIRTGSPVISQSTRSSLRKTGWLFKNRVGLADSVSGSVEFIQPFHRGVTLFLRNQRRVGSGFSNQNFRLHLLYKVFCGFVIFVRFGCVENRIMTLHRIIHIDLTLILLRSLISPSILLLRRRPSKRPKPTFFLPRQGITVSNLWWSRPHSELRLQTREYFRLISILVPAFLIWKPLRTLILRIVKLGITLKIRIQLSLTVFRHILPKFTPVFSKNWQHRFINRRCWSRTFPISSTRDRNLLHFWPLRSFLKWITVWSSMSRIWP